MRSALFLSALGGFVLVQAQSPSPTVNIPPNPSTTDGIPTIEGALVYDGPPVIGFTGPGGNATIQSNLPMATYMATLPMTNFDGATMVMGSITGMTASNGTGVVFMVNFTGFPDVATNGPFVYHIHQFPVGPDGNCTAAGPHLDPTMRGELHACEAPAPQTCQAGDLAGKHGNVTATSLSVTYTDDYVSTDPSSPYFFGNRSIVIHSSNATRLTCANFTMTSPSTTTSMAPSGTGAGTSATPSMFQGAATKAMSAGGVSVLGMVLAVGFALLL